MTELKRRVSGWAQCVLGLVALVSLLSYAQVARGQSSGGSGVLTGVVVDARRTRSSASVVTATSPASQGEQIVVTDSTGFYRIPSLPSGVYTLRLEKDGYRPYEREGIALRSESTLRVNAELLPNTLKSEEVVVVAKAPTVDVGSSTVGANITQDFTRRVPTAAPGGKGSSTRSLRGGRRGHPGSAIRHLWNVDRGHVLTGERLHDRRPVRR